MNGRLTARGGLVAAALTVTAALALAACSSPSKSDPGGTKPAARSSAPATKAAGSTRKASGALSGKWSGRYSGAYNGTFTVRWHQSGSHLHGTIHISNPGDTLPINGIVRGNAIRFGTLGSMAITYNGTVSGNSMSGSYKVHSASGASGGPWSASRA
jgi:hypothetical protein